MKQHLNNDFTQWLEERSTQSKKKLDTIKKDTSRSWYTPQSDKSPRVYDKKRFDTESLQQDYLKAMKDPEALAAEVVALRFQTGHIRSCERAYLLRHASVPRLLTHGYTENVIETNGLYDKFMRDYPAQTVESAKKKYEAKTR